MVTTDSRKYKSSRKRPLFTSRSSSAVGRRNHAHVDLPAIWIRRPGAPREPRARAKASAACRAASRRSRPKIKCRRCADSNAPMRSRSAPVKLPRKCPKSSLSIKLGEIDPQSTMMNGLSARLSAADDFGSDQFFAGAALAFDEHVGFGFCDLVEHREKTLHRQRHCPTNRRSSVDRGARRALPTLARAREPRDSPISMMHSGSGKSASRIETPLMRVPLSESVSLMRQAALSRVRLTMESRHLTIFENDDHFLRARRCARDRHRAPRIFCWRCLRLSRR